MSLIEREYKGFKDVSIINKTEEDAEEFRRKYVKVRKTSYKEKLFYINEEVIEEIFKNNKLENFYGNCLLFTGSNKEQNYNLKLKSFYSCSLYFIGNKSEDLK